MDNVAFDYEPLVWDLNPEGVGVQPMIANVTISFKFIGGSTLYGPINKLQNALSFNYFANAQVYDARADYIATAEEANKTYDPSKQIDKERKMFIPGLSDEQNKTTETNYGLVLGMDMTATPYDALPGQVVTNATDNPNDNQTNAANKATNNTVVTTELDGTSSDILPTNTAPAAEYFYSFSGSEMTVISGSTFTGFTPGDTYLAELTVSADSQNSRVFSKEMPNGTISSKTIDGKPKITNIKEIFVY